jgi:hypothetical protein
MTNYEKLLSAETVTHYAYLLSNSIDCERCPCKCDNPYETSDYSCTETIKKWLESEVDKYK